MGIIVYKISTRYLGDEIILSPKITDNPAKGEDIATPRISVCTTIPNCIKALDLTSQITKNNPYIKIYVYRSYVDINNIYVPDTDQVPDAWLTGELWILNDQKFFNICTGTLRKHIDIALSAYSRYIYLLLMEWKRYAIEFVLQIYMEMQIVLVL